MDKNKIGPFSLCAINIVAVLGLKELPVMATLGLQSIFFFTITAVLFFIPLALIVAELGSKIPSYGGIYTWVQQAFGDRCGFFAIWLYWIKNIIGYPLALSMFAGIILYAASPVLSSNKYLITMIMILCYWICTFLNFYGMRTSKIIIVCGLIIGTVIPLLIIIFLSILWAVKGNHSFINFTFQGLVAKTSYKSNIALILGIVFGFSGIEMSAAHIKEVTKPRRNYPLAIFLSVSIILAISIFATLGIAMVVAKGKNIFVSSFIEAISIFLNGFGMHYLLFILVPLMSIGTLTNMFTWTLGPSKSLLKSAMDGHLPAFFKKTNQKGIPTNILFLQGAFVSAASLMFIFVPNLNNSYWILMNAAAVLYLIIAVLLILATIRLRLPKHQDSFGAYYKIPGGKAGLAIIAAICITTCVATFLISFIPPVNTGLASSFSYEIYSAILLALLIISPFMIYKREKYFPQNIPKE